MLRRMGRAELSSRRYPQPVHRKGDSKRRRRHRGARGGRVVRAAVRRQCGVERTQRDGRDATLRGLPQSALGAPRRAEVHLRGVRIERTRSGDVHREQQQPSAISRADSPRTASTSRATWRGFGRRRPDIAVTRSRRVGQHHRRRDGHHAVALIGWAVVPTMFGRDARLQVLTSRTRWGRWNARRWPAGPARQCRADGIIMLSQAIRRAGRIPLPVPGFGVWALDSLRRANRYTEINREQFDYLSYGRVMDTTRD